jgi:GNAT superfamily N-acetyltransferase
MEKVTYQEEPFVDAWPDIQAHIAAHWQEIAQDQAVMPLDPDLAGYTALADAGMLAIVTARTAEQLIGYFVTFVRPHLHYQQTLCGYVDVYYVAPAYRQHGVGVALFQTAERLLRARGVQKLFAATKVYADHSPLFEGLGWIKTETLYTKWIEAAPWE